MGATKRVLGKIQITTEGYVEVCWLVQAQYRHRKQAPEHLLICEGFHYYLFLAFMLLPTSLPDFHSHQFLTSTTQAFSSVPEP